MAVEPVAKTNERGTEQGGKGCNFPKFVRLFMLARILILFFMS